MQRYIRFLLYNMKQSKTKHEVVHWYWYRVPLVVEYQGWGGPAVQYRQATPVLGNLGPVADWRSYFYD